MGYVVYHNKGRFSSDNNKKGYFMSYKDKISESYTENIMKAKEYKSLRSALSRIYNMSYLASYSEIIEKFENSEIRKQKISNLTDKEYVRDFSKIRFFDGFIEKIEWSKNVEYSVVSAHEEIYDYCKKHLKKKIKKNKKITHHDYDVVIIDDPDDDFWN